MIVHQVEQGTVEWLALRIGIPTASEFECIVTPTGKLSAQARGYAIRLITETLLNQPTDGLDKLEWVARGRELEPRAASMYEFAEGVETQVVGFITTDDGRIGASPDRLIVGVNAGLEIKCPAPHTHMGYLLDGFGKNYKVQAQGQLLVAGFEYVDRYSYHPEMPPALTRTYRDEPFIATLSQALTDFLDLRDGLLEQAKQAGDFVERRRVLTAHEQAYAQEAA